MQPAIAPPAARLSDGFRHRGGQVTRLEAFVDAAFAFALTLLVISIDAIPDSVEALLQVLKGIPAFAASFAIVAMFWHGHAQWSRRYGLDDAVATLLSLLLVFEVMVFVYPLKMLFASMFHWFSGGFLPANFEIGSTTDLQLLFLVYAVGFGVLGATMALLTRHAWRRRDALQLDRHERIGTRVWLLHWWVIVAVSALSLLLALLIPLFPQGWLYGLPGMCYGLLGLQAPLLAWYERRLERSDAGPEAGPEAGPSAGP